MKSMITKWYYRGRLDQGVNTVIRFKDHYHCDCYTYSQHKACAHIDSTRHQTFYGLRSFQVMGYPMVMFKSKTVSPISTGIGVILSYEYRQDELSLAKSIMTLARSGYDIPSIYNLIGIKLSGSLSEVSDYVSIYGEMVA